MIKASSILNPANKFRVKDGIAGVFISSANLERLADVRQGGSKYCVKNTRWMSTGIELLALRSDNASIATLNNNKIK